MTRLFLNIFERGTKMSNKTINKMPLNKERLLSILKEKGISLRSLDRDPNLDACEKTIRRALTSGAISPTILNSIANYLGVDPNYLSGCDEYSTKAEQQMSELNIVVTKEEAKVILNIATRAGCELDGDILKLFVHVHGGVVIVMDRYKI
jgi:lambda repressor-like predicted transcriptional regulator